MKEELKVSLDVTEDSTPTHETDTLPEEAMGELDWGPDVGGEVLSNYDVPKKTGTG